MYEVLWLIFIILNIIGTHQYPFTNDLFYDLDVFLNKNIYMFCIYVFKGMGES